MEAEEGPRAKAWRWPLQVEKGKDRDSPLELPEGSSSVDT